MFIFTRTFSSKHRKEEIKILCPYSVIQRPHSRIHKIMQRARVCGCEKWNSSDSESYLHLGSRFDKIVWPLVLGSVLLSESLGRDSDATHL